MIELIAIVLILALLKRGWDWLYKMDNNGSVMRDSITGETVYYGSEWALLADAATETLRDQLGDGSDYERSCCFVWVLASVGLIIVGAIGVMICL